jgi:cytochrome c biogenesis protein CcmG/thiol:disulfide interchange protein DsbE
VATPPLILIALILVALGIVLARQSSTGGSFGINSSGGPGALTARVVPDYQFTLEDGSTLALQDLKGRGAVLNFWASWCVPCQDEAPTLARIAKEYDPQQVAFVGISEWDTDSDVKSFMTRYGVGYQTGVDLGGKLAIDLGVTGIPETFFVRPDGSFASHWIGPLNEDQLRKQIEQIQP